MAYANEILNLMAMHFGKYNENSNIGKILKSIEITDNRFLKTCEDMKKTLDIDQANGGNLESIYGANKNLSRKGLDDVNYRKVLKLETKINNSDGQIGNIDETISVLIGDSYLGVSETWNSPDYNNDPAGIIARYENLEQVIQTEYEESEDDPWFLNGIYKLDGQKTLDGGLTFAYSDYFTEIAETEKLIKDYIQRIVSAGVNVYLENIIDINNKYEIFNDVSIDEFIIIETGTVEISREMGVLF